MTKSDTLKKRMLAALSKSLGVVSTACEMAGISRNTHYNWLKDDEAYKAEVEAIGEASIDFAESKLFELIKGVQLPETKVFIHEGKPVTYNMIKNYPPDNTSIIFYLKTKGKARGYVERQEVEPVGSFLDFLIESSK